jgi:hypothetical protein
VTVRERLEDVDLALQILEQLRGKVVSMDGLDSDLLMCFL